MGSYTLKQNNGEYNTALGYKALYNNTTGYINTAIGDEALYRNTSGRNNVAVGSFALYNNNIGIQNTAVGDYSGPTSTHIENTTSIGYDAKVDVANKVRIGNNYVTVIGGAVAWTNHSDERLKENIEPVDSGLSLINDLKPVVYHRINNDAPDTEMGLLAQEVAATLQRHGLGNSGMVHQPTEDAYMSLRYNDLLAPMIKAIQELDDASEAKDEQIASLEQELKSQQEEFLAIVQSQQEQMLAQQEQIAQLQQMVEHQFAER